MRKSILSKIQFGMYLLFAIALFFGFIPKLGAECTCEVGGLDLQIRYGMSQRIFNGGKVAIERDSQTVTKITDDNGVFCVSADELPGTGSFSIVEMTDPSYPCVLPLTRIEDNYPEQYNKLVLHLGHVGATVQVGDITAYSDFSGTAIISDLQSGEYVVTATANTTTLISTQVSLNYQTNHLSYCPMIPYHLTLDPNCDYDLDPNCNTFCPMTIIIDAVGGVPTTYYSGYLSSVESSTNIPDISFSINDTVMGTSSAGSYIIPYQIVPGTYDITLSAEGYYDSTETFTQDNLGLIPEGSLNVSLNPIKGDLNADNRVDLTDCIIALKTIGGDALQDILRSDYVASGADLGIDNHSGIEEAIYALQTAAGIRGYD